MIRSSDSVWPPLSSPGSGQDLAQGRVVEPAASAVRFQPLATSLSKNTRLEAASTMREVLTQAPLRDVLMWLSTTDLFRARWTDQILDEWTETLLAKRPDSKRDKYLDTLACQQLPGTVLAIRDFKKLI